MLKVLGDLTKQKCFDKYFYLEHWCHSLHHLLGTITLGLA